MPKSTTEPKKFIGSGEDFPLSEEELNDLILEEEEEDVLYLAEV